MGGICFKSLSKLSPELNSQMNRFKTTLTSVDIMIINNYNNKVPLKFIDPRTGRDVLNYSSR